MLYRATGSASVPAQLHARLVRVQLSIRHWSGVLVVLGLVTGCAGVDVGAIQELLGQAGVARTRPLDEGSIAAGLKQALKVGTDRAVAATSRENGYLRNSLIRIPLPQELERVASGLRAVGLRRQVDELEVSLNRAAERAAGEATPVFVNAIRQMSFADARGILTGGDRAATNYFESHTRAELSSLFTPIVEQSMHQVGLVQLYSGIVAWVDSVPLVASPDLDLEDYVTRRALDGLFTVLGEEEARIREDPAARTTALLRRVFAGS